MKKQILPDVSTKNTKEQILSAYAQALLKNQLQDLEVPEKKLVCPEQHLVTLQQGVEDCPKNLLVAVKETENNLSAVLLKNSEFENQLQHKTQALEFYLYKIKEKNVLIKELTARSDQATKWACKALELSSQRYLYQVSEAA